MISFHMDADCDSTSHHCQDAPINHFARYGTRIMSDKYRVTLKLLMDQRKMSQRALARISRVSQGTISRMLHGVHYPDHVTLEKLALALKVTVAQVTGEAPLQPDKDAAYVFKVMQELPPYKREMLLAAAKSLKSDP